MTKHPPIQAHLKEAPYPFQDHLGFEVTHWARDYARLEQGLKPFLANRGGVPHGGVYATLLDTAMGFAGCYTDDPKDRVLALTLTLNTSFLSRPKGIVLIAEGWKTGGGRRTYFAESVLHDETGEKIASASGAFLYRSA